MTEKLFYWCFGVSASLLLVGYQLGVVLPRAYGSDAIAIAAPLVLLVAIATGAILARRAMRSSARLAGSLTLLSLLSSGAGYLLWIAFDRGHCLSAVLVGAPAIAGLFTGFAAVLAVRAYGPVFAELGLFADALNPLRAAGIAATFLAILAAFPHLGLLRSGALLGLLLGCAAAFLPALDEALDRPSSQPSAIAIALPCAALIGCLGATGAAGAFVPLSDFQNYGGDVLYVLDGPRGRHVITRVQRAVALFSNDLLATTSTDNARFAEALAHPALAVRSRKERARILVFSNGIGAVEREILRCPGISAVTSVVGDRRLSELAERSILISELGAPVFSDPRVERIEAEPAPFIARSRKRYDVIIADFGDPTSYLEGKHYTRYFFAALRAILEPDGVFALQVTSPLRTPRAHASILATLQAAGFFVDPYRAPLPTLGEWGFALAHSPELALRGRAAIDRPVVPAGTSLVTSQNLRDFFALPPSGPTAPAQINYLYDQPAVALYRDEERQLSE